jgi:hypothetical protein
MGAISFVNVTSAADRAGVWAVVPTVAAISAASRLQGAKIRGRSLDMTASSAAGVRPELTHLYTWDVPRGPTFFRTAASCSTAAAVLTVSKASGARFVGLRFVDAEYSLSRDAIQATSVADQAVTPMRDATWRGNSVIIVFVKERNVH